MTTFRWPLRIWTLAKNASQQGHIAVITPTRLFGDHDEPHRLHLALSARSGDKIVVTWERGSIPDHRSGRGDWHVVRVQLLGPRGGMQSLRLRDVPAIVSTWRAPS